MIYMNIVRIFALRFTSLDRKPVERPRSTSPPHATVADDVKTSRHKAVITSPSKRSNQDWNTSYGTLWLLMTL